MQRASRRMTLLEMTDGSIQPALQTHLTEFSEVRQEINERLKGVDRLPFLSLGISWALISFALSGGGAVALSDLRRLALYLVPSLATVTGAAWLFKTRKIGQLGVYIRDQLRPKVNQLVGSSEESHASRFEVLEWESSDERLTHNWMTRLCEWIPLLSAFVFSGAVAQVLILLQKTGTLSQRFPQLESKTMFCVNCLLIAGSLFLFVLHLVIGRAPKPKSKVFRD